MENFDAIPFLVVDGQPISLGQVWRYLQIFGKLHPFVQDVISQHVICQEVQRRDDLEASTADFEQAVIGFRLKQQVNFAGCSIPIPAASRRSITEFVFRDALPHHY